MAVTDLETWMNEFGRPGTVWYAKRLSGNDTLANETHQAGPYIPKEFLFQIFPQINNPQARNPDIHIDVYIDSHADHRQVRVIWYNNALDPNREARTRGRNETRITGFGGQASPLLNPDSTGSIAIFVFVLNDQGTVTECHVWLCDNELEEEMIEGRIGPVEPKLFIIWRPGVAGGLIAAAPSGVSPCRLARAQIPPQWLQRFPTGEEIVAKTRELRPDAALPVDQRLMRRRDCEFEIFKSVEEAVYLPRIAEGFPSVENFIALAQTILQSRKSRSGTSLELHTRDIFIEEALVANKHFSHRPMIEGNKRPDFLFPSTAAYNDGAFPQNRLRMLAAKTTCKDRWRQVISEADRIATKHLLTLQEGVSENQFREMTEAGVRLVVPTGLHDSYPDAVRPHLVSFESFIAELRLLRV
jgi:hypothetical protein